MSAQPLKRATAEARPLGRVIKKIQDALEVGSPSIGVDRVLEAAEHHFAHPGKSMRARISLHASSALQQDAHNATCFAATVESLHNASLVLDDLQDGALIRRDQPTVAAQFGQDVALTLTLRLSTAAFLCLSDARGPNFAQLSAQTHFVVSETAVGQTRDLEKKRSSTIEELKTIAALKSGPLFGLSLSLPLIASGHDESVPKAREIASLFGLGYQILDDLKDRTTDRLRESDANIVNAIANEMGQDRAEKLAREEAQQFLGAARALANELPSNSGSVVVQLIDHLIQNEG